MIARYHAGDEKSVETFSEWPFKSVEDVVRRIQSRDDPEPHWQAWQFQAAAMLLTDVIVRSTSTDLLPLDPQLTLVQAVLDRGGDALTPFAVAWVSATASWLRRQHRIAAALHVLEEARRNWPDAPDLWYQTGITREVSGIADANLAAAGPPLLQMSTALDGFGGVSTDPLSPKPRWTVGRSGFEIGDRAHRQLDGARDMLARAARRNVKVTARRGYQK